MSPTQVSMMLRLVAYWLVFLATWWMCAFIYATNTPKGWYYFMPEDDSPVWTDKAFNITAYYGAHHLGLTGPLILAGTLCYLLMTNGPLTLHRWSWMLRPLQRLRGNYGTNQFGMGDTHMGLVFVVYNLIPILVYMYCYTFVWEKVRTIPLEDVVVYLSLGAGFGASLAMAFFLVPVARHSVLLAAVGFSPVHALRLHTWSGWLAFWCAEFHGLSYIVYMIMTPSQGSIYDRSFPKQYCWGLQEFTSDDYGNGTLVLNTTLADEYYEPCIIPWWNITGYAAGMAFLALVVTSFNGFRRRYYRLFYLCHVTLGPLTIILTIIHWDGIVIYLIPSLVYYLASTMPTLVQALASRWRGGVRIRRVVQVPNSGGCLEVHVGTTVESSHLLDKEACMVVKLLVPNISMVWHPFTVYKVPTLDPTSTRFLMRPIGPFTKALAERLVQPEKPIMMLDGYYRGGDRIQEALAHDVACIVCGGVAVTPFLSMIPLVIQARSRLGASNLLKKLVVHFAVREEGLATFVVQYFDVFKNMVQQADSLSDFTLHVTVYHTGQGKMVDETGKDAGQTKMLDDTEKNVDAIVGNVSNDTELDATRELNSKDCSIEKPSTESDASDEHVSKPIHSDDTKGHDMEHARFMPAIYSSVQANMVHVLTMGVSLWMGFLIYNHFLDTFTRRFFESQAVNHLFRPASTFCWIVVSVGLGIVFEFIFLHFSKYLPKVQPETYVVSSFDPEVANTSESKVGKDNTDADKSHRVVLEHRVGRPVASDIFDGLESASCPGIFMCGPPGQTQMVRRHAATENSYFGMTRYALYEEPFEM